MKKILVTGSSGFIGFHLAKNLSVKNNVLGIDNHNSYYSKTIKKKRLSILKKKKNFNFCHLNLTNEKKLKKIFKKKFLDIKFDSLGAREVKISI